MTSKKEDMVRPRHVALVGDGHGAPGTAEALKRSLARLESAAGQLFDAGVVIISFQDRWLESLLAGPEVGETAGVLGDFLKRWQPPAGATLLFRGEAGTLPAPMAFLAGRYAAPPPDGGRCLVWFLNYGGKEEILRAARRMALSPGGDDAAPEAFERHLYTAGLPDPDFIIYTGGGSTLPDFMVYQMSYAELHFLPRPWTEVTPADMEEALRDYVSRERRYGRVTPGS